MDPRSRRRNRHRATLALVVIGLGWGVWFLLAPRSAPPYRTPRYLDRVQELSRMPPTPNAIVFLGNSLTEMGPWHDLLPDRPIVNQGIGGDTALGILARLDQVVRHDPAAVFLMVGVNDLHRGATPEEVAGTVRVVLERLRRRLPDADLHLHAVLPVNDSLFVNGDLNRHIAELNARLEPLAREVGASWIDLRPLYADPAGQLDASLTYDGVHLHPAAYRRWAEHVRSAVEDAG